MLGAIIGDIVGSPFEFANVKTFRHKSLFTPGCEFTDDTICTVAGAALTDFGKAYIIANPHLRGPVDWKWIVGTIVAATVAATGITALLTACSLLAR